MNALLRFEGVGTMANTRAGVFKTNLSGGAAYSSFCPAPLPPKPQIELDSDAVALLVEANRRLVLLDERSSYVPNVDLFVSMYVRKEALMSSQIEGTQAALEDVFDPALDENANRDVADVVNYVKATEFAVQRQRELPLCNRLIKEIHAVLTEGVRGQEKSPGEFRRSQNWIGGQGSTLKNARYIPPNVEDMTEAMSELEKYINADDGLDALIRAALIHYQFETIHPFLDGNGRVGRLLIILFLMGAGTLSSPVLYISLFLKKNRIEYYDRMTEVRNKGNYEQWVKFFLQAIAESAQDAADTISKLSQLHNQNVKVVREFGRASKTAMRFLEYLEQHPIIEIRKTAAALDIAFSTASLAVNRLCDAGILAQSAGGTQRGRVFSYEPYLALLREGT
jgi:Fic family protein